MRVRQTYISKNGFGINNANESQSSQYMRKHRVPSLQTGALVRTTMVDTENHYLVCSWALHSLSIPRPDFPSPHSTCPWDQRHVMEWNQPQTTICISLISDPTQELMKPLPTHIHINKCKQNSSSWRKGDMSTHIYCVMSPHGYSVEYERLM